MSRAPWNNAFLNGPHNTKRTLSNAPVATRRRKMHFGHQRGIPRISTVAKNLIDRMMDLIWKMDNVAPKQLEEIAEAVKKVRRPFDDIYTDIRPESLDKKIGKEYL